MAPEIRIIDRARACYASAHASTRKLTLTQTPSSRSRSRRCVRDCPTARADPQPFSRYYGRAGFFIYWMLSWCGMLALGGAMEVRRIASRARKLTLQVMGPFCDRAKCLDVCSHASGSEVHLVRGCSLSRPVADFLASSSSSGSSPMCRSHSVRHAQSPPIFADRSRPGPFRASLSPAHALRLTCCRASIVRSAQGLAQLTRTDYGYGPWSLPVTLATDAYAAMPFWHIKEAVLALLLGTKNVIGRSFGVLVRPRSSSPLR